MESSVSRVTALSWNRDPGDTCPPRSNSSSSVLSSQSSTSPSTQSQLELVRACQSWLEAILARPELTLPAHCSHLNHQHHLQLRAQSPSPSPPPRWPAWLGWSSCLCLNVAMRFNSSILAKLYSTKGPNNVQLLLQVHINAFSCFFPLYYGIL